MVCPQPPNQGSYLSIDASCSRVVWLSVQGWLEDVSKVEKYVMSDADYDAREDTYRKFKEERLREVR